MCGIAGIFHYTSPDKPVSRSALERMTRAIAHRGPDGEGFHVDGPIGFGHRRLAIVDLTPTGDQPMANEDRSLWIDYNGEFYNHAVKRSEIAARHVFRGTSDTETFLHLFEERGVDCLQDLAAIFAVAFWDARARRLTLARDPLGVKQLYYHDDGKRLVFASEIKALLCCEDVPRAIDPEGVNQYLHFHTPIFERTFFKDIRQLCPGEYVEVTASGLRRRKYWEVSDFTARGGSPEENVGALRDVLARVVRDQLMSDVPVGSFFSGGIDSSTVAAYAKRAGQAPRCFGVHFADQGVADEGPYQEAAAKALGLDLELITLDGSSFPDDLMRLMYQQDQPVIGAAMLPMYHVSKLAAGKVKVCLGGQAADEIFAGYTRYALARPWLVAKSWFAGRQALASGGTEGASVGGNLLHEVVDFNNWRRLFRNAAHLPSWRARYFENMAKVPDLAWRTIFAPGELVSRDECRDLYHDRLDASGATDPATRVMHWEMQTYLTGLFHQDDRMSMAHGLESRVPLADPRLVRFAFRIPFELKFRAGATKWILREAVSDAIPGEVLNRRKVGFATPAERWMKGAHAGFVREVLLSSRARQRGLWNPRGIGDLLDHPEHPLWFDVAWKALCIEVWAQVFLDRAETRSEREPSARSQHEPAAQSQAEPAARSERESAKDQAGLSSGVRLPLALGPTTEFGTGVSRGHANVQGSARLRFATPVPSVVEGLGLNGGRTFTVRNAIEEARDLGLGRTLYRAQWELKRRSGWIERTEQPPPALPEATAQQAAEILRRALPFDAPSVVDAVRDRIPVENLTELVESADDATKGRILCFSRWKSNFGQPIDWQLNPQNGRRWNVRLHWSRALKDEPQVGDVKLTWEVARFPQAFWMARAGAFVPQLRERMAESLTAQVSGFLARNPYGYGIHWASGQELAVRAMAWMFGFAVLGREPILERTAGLMARGIHEAVTHVERYFEFSRRAVNNNHLIAEALALFLGATVFPDLPGAERRRQLALSVLEEQATTQFFADGVQFQYSHNYQRVVMLYYLWASALLQHHGRPIPQSWRTAMERSLDFLLAHQNPLDGRLPNFGANDGALPSILSTCNFSDFRPLLQMLSILVRGERMYQPGPWDEASAWMLGAKSLEAPLRAPRMQSVSFTPTGYHVLRGKDPSSFCAFRCGTLKQRFSQVDMLALDVWWRGHNVLVDAGTYLFNGPQRWHDHFVGTESHNTVQVDRADQMLHYRRFKNLYWTRAKLLRFEAQERWSVCEGEHYGYQRSAGCIHRRSVLFAGDEVWVVIDRLAGKGSHHVRLHWLGGEYPYEYLARDNRFILSTPAGPFTVYVLDERGKSLSGDVAFGANDPPRGWLSRYYGEKVPVPSWAVERDGALPCCFVSVLSAGEAHVEVNGAQWRIEAGDTSLGFTIEDSRFAQVIVVDREHQKRASL